jgi:hypothetical protein
MTEKEIRKIIREELKKTLENYGLISPDKNKDVGELINHKEKDVIDKGIIPPSEDDRERDEIQK